MLRNQVSCLTSPWKAYIALLKTNLFPWSEIFRISPLLFLSLPPSLCMQSFSQGQTAFQSKASSTWKSASSVWMAGTAASDYQWLTPASTSLISLPILPRPWWRRNWHKLYSSPQDLGSSESLAVYCDNFDCHLHCILWNLIMVVWCDLFNIPGRRLYQQLLENKLALN